MKTQLWKPDTCECEIEETYDYSTDPATLVERKHLFVCDGHKDWMPDDVANENVNKNLVVNKIAEILPELTEVITQDGNEITRWKKGFEPKVSFDSERNMQIDLNATDEEKALVNNALDPQLMKRTSIA